jgi:hypothetical protein
MAGFWPTYFVPKFEADWHVHLHGVAMFLWVLLLIAQAGLVRARQLPLHRALGKVSYGLVPVIVVSTLLLPHYRMKQQGLTEELLYFFYVQLSLLAVFVLAYSLAIANKSRPQLHARYMVCTALTLIDPILARIFDVHLGIERPLLQVISFGLIDVILLALIGADWRAERRARVYPTMLVVFVVTQIPTFFLFKLPAWTAFTEGYSRLPLP